MNVYSEEAFFNFDMFNGDLNEDLNFIFSETPETPATSNDETDPMAITSQLPADPFEFNMEESAVLKSTKLGKLPNFNLDMNNPTVLRLYTQLFMLQQDSKRQEFIFCSPDHFIQDTLHSLARMLGLEYEHSIRPSQVRISKPSHTPYLEPGKLGDTQSEDTFYPNSVPGRTGMQIVQSLSPIPGNLDATELHPNENFSMGLSLEDLPGKAPVDLGWLSKWNPQFTEDNILDSPLTDGNNFSSMARKIPSTVSFPNQSHLEVGAQVQSAPGKDTPEYMMDSWPSRIEHEVSTSAVGGSTTGMPVCTEIQFIFEPTPKSRESNHRGRRGPLNSSALRESKEVKAQGGACWKCRILRKKCDPHEPCQECQKGDAGSVWRAVGCRRGPLECERRRIRMCPRYKDCAIQEPFPSDPEAETDDCQQIMTDSSILGSLHPGNKKMVQGNLGGELPTQRGIFQSFAEINQSFEPHRFGDLRAGSINSLHACFSTVLHYLQDLWPSFQISCALSSLLDVPALSIFVVEKYATSEYAKLIYNTFSCLCSCLSALESIASNSIVTEAHRNCRATKCNYENSKAIENNIRDYLNELSRIIFSKKTRRGNKSWWLPVFCSLCIQSFVKKLLQALLKEQCAVGTNPNSSDKHLQEVVQLFKALSSGFDPIMNRDDAQLDVHSVRKAIFYQRWSPNTTQSSFQYLESLFYIQESRTMDLLKAFTTEPPIANLRPKEMPPKSLRQSDSTEQQEKICFKDGNIDGALCNDPGRKRDGESTLTIETPYEDPKDPELAKREKPLNYVLQLQEKNSHLEIVSNASITTDPTQKLKIDAQKPANNTKEASQGNIAPLVEAQPVSSPPILSQSQDDPPETSFVCSELDSQLEVEPSLTSLAQSCFTYQVENGRTYHSYHSGKYYLPNDEREQDRMDMQYHMIINVVLGGRKFLSPIENPKKILDQCTGTGIWAIDMADEFREAEGTDLSPIQPEFVPPNLTFLIDDVDQDWLFRKATTYDFIHCSFGYGYSSQNWEFFLSESYRCLAPGGWVEIKDFDIVALSPDDSLPRTSAISRWHKKLVEGASRGNINVRAFYSTLEQIFQKSGFINIKLEIMPIPCGSWAKDKKLKEVGRWQKQCFFDGLQAYSVAIFTRILGWPMCEVEILLAEVRRELGNRAYHWYWPFFVIYGQKPEN